MANAKPIKDGSGLLAEIDPAADTLDAKLYVSDGGKVLVRTSTGAGPHEEADIGSLSFGALGTGFTDGGGSGTIPDGTVVALDGDFEMTGGGTYPVKFERSAAAVGDDENFLGLKFDNDNFLMGCTSPADDNIFGVVGRFFTGLVGVSIRMNQQNIYMRGQTETGIATFSCQPGTFSFTRSEIDSGSTLWSVSINMNTSGIVISDSRANPSGLAYTGDYSGTIAANERSIPDVGTTKKITQRLAFLASC